MNLTDATLVLLLAARIHGTDEAVSRLSYFLRPSPAAWGFFWAQKKGLNSRWAL
jgi:hypothetical protein